MIAAIFGVSGLALSDEERAFFRAANPAGFILFGRNVANPDQLRGLTDELRSLSARDNLPILIDQEGGRVSRLRPPDWPVFPAAAAFDKLYLRAPASAMAAARFNAVALADALALAGINIDCCPMLDLRHPGYHDIVGDRSLGGDPMQVAALGRAMLEGFDQVGVAGVIKHLPGHGRARADSHFELPVVSEAAQALAIDVAPFKALASQARMAMTAHLVYQAWDPLRPATLSPTVIGDIIRTEIGFDGVLMTDDIEMKALDGRVGLRAEQAIAAGCDLVLHCSAEMIGMEEVAARVGAVSAVSAKRLAKALPEGLPIGNPDRMNDAIAQRDAYFTAVA